MSRPGIDLYHLSPGVNHVGPDLASGRANTAASHKVTPYIIPRNQKSFAETQ